MLKHRAINPKLKPISSPFKLKPILKPAVKLSTYHGRRTRQEWNVINKNPFGDKDRDGVRNIFDCRPLNKKKKGPGEMWSRTLAFKMEKEGPSVEDSIVARKFMMFGNDEHDQEMKREHEKIRKLHQEHIQRRENRKTKLNDFRTDPDDEHAVERFAGYKAAKEAEEEAEYEKDEDNN